MNNRITNQYISKLEDDEIFVFGSNEAGRHGKGAAVKALEFGAIYGVGSGLRGHTYAIPTKNGNIETLKIEKVKKYVGEFIKFAEINPQLKFLVTEIGCGLAGFKYYEIAPFFKDCLYLPNVYLPLNFWNHIK